jgi:hypothetical protein
MLASLLVGTSDTSMSSMRAMHALSEVSLRSSTEAKVPLPFTSHSLRIRFFVARIRAARSTALPAPGPARGLPSGHLGVRARPHTWSRGVSAGSPLLSPGPRRARRAPPWSPSSTENPRSSRPRPEPRDESCRRGKDTASSSLLSRPTPASVARGRPGQADSPTPATYGCCKGEEKRAERSSLPRPALSQWTFLTEQRVRLR